MDYGKSGNPKAAKDKHQPHDLNRHGAPKTAGKKAEDKAALLERMKAAAAARKNGDKA